MKAGIPIALGYLAVSFSLGIIAVKAGLTPFGGFVASILNMASAGEYVGFTLIASAATFLEVAVVTFITNAGYLLMSAALSQRVSPDTPFIHRLLLGYFVTDELFGIAIARPGFVNPFYTYGAVILAAPCWSIGTALGIMAGNILPLRLVSAFSVALYGMFLAIIIPPARKSRVITGLIAVCFTASLAASYLPGIRELSEGMRTIILTISISAIAAILFPKKPENDGRDASSGSDPDVENASAATQDGVSAKAKEVTAP